MINCPGCGNANPDDAVKCSTCSRVLETYCPVCGCKNSIAATLCIQCGRVLDESSDSKNSDKKVDDPVAEMLEPTSKSSNASPKRAMIMLIIGLFVFGLLFLRNRAGFRYHDGL